MFGKKHYKHNVSYDTDGFVLGQANPPTSLMRYGAFSMAYNGCEIIAVYNAMRLIGRPQPLSETVRDFERGLHPLLFGVFGTKPSRVGRYLKKKGFRAEKRCRLDGLEALSEDGDILILSFWTGRKFVSPIHTVALRCIADGALEVYNLYNSAKAVMIRKSLAEVIGKGRFICGYRIE